MDKIPQELEDLINDPKLLKKVRQQPGSERFQATVLGLAALKYLKDQSADEPSPEPKAQKGPPDNG